MMENLTQEARRKLILSFYQKHEQNNKRYTVNHFKSMNVCSSTTCSILQRLEHGVDATRKAGSGGYNKKLHGNQIRSMKAVAINHVSVSTRKLAQKYNTS